MSVDINSLVGQIIHADCYEVLSQLGDKSVDLLLADPPYGLCIAQGGRVGSGAPSAKWASGGSRDYGRCTWDLTAPLNHHFAEMLRVSQKQIVWGGNYFAAHLGGSNGWLVWDKGNENPSMSDCELAWTSEGKAVKIYRHLWAGFRQQSGLIEDRYHPTQKPVPLYKWCIEKYTKPGDLVLDPMCGSGTTALACHALGRRFICIERELDYVNVARNRLRDAQTQLSLFDRREIGTGGGSENSAQQGQPEMPCQEELKL